MPRAYGTIILYLKARKIISQGYLNYRVQVKESISVVNDFPEVYREDLPEVPLEREIDFGIDLVLDTQPIILLYSILDAQYLSSIKAYSAQHLLAK
ncbi:hypothetical protein MTR67_043126 [Solanum verrucosum]|uniref:Uncharacterized protein n=1 Tax=Solanum verrucosum TaxID=315347 RepID=A0AAF0ZSE3_SOLVR|nr:hypothetical protein MTR67_043126 [Solanum verrucosum]